jgi:hypothetical protein
VTAKPDNRIAQRYISIGTIYRKNDRGEKPVAAQALAVPATDDRSRAGEAQLRLGKNLMLAHLGDLGDTIFCGVTPTKVGVHFAANQLSERWIPAFAGMTPK